MKDKVFIEGIELQKAIGMCKDCFLYKNSSDCAFMFSCHAGYCYKKKSDLRKEKLLEINK
jgi:hypothetical protein